MISPAEINRRNAEFWAEQTRLRDVRMQNRLLTFAAFDMLRDEEMRGVPIRSRLTLEACLERTARLQAIARQELDYETKHKVLSESGRAGGLAPRRLNPLQRLIQRTIEKKPDITEAEVLKALRRSFEVRDTIVGIDDGLIEYVLDSGRIANAPISGLKHRLSRARNRAKSRKALRENSPS